MKQKIKELFGRRVRERRLALGLTQQDLAKGAGLHRSYIGEIELGKRNITLESATKIAKVLQVEVASLLEERD